MAMANGYANANGPPEYSPYQQHLHHPPPHMYDPGQGPDDPRIRPRLAPPALMHAASSSSSSFGGPGPGGMHVQYPSVPGQGQGENSGGAGAGAGEDDANRSRNARAQRRHREKRKAHVKNLEDSVVSLNNQLEDARRQLAHFHSTDPRSIPSVSAGEMQELHHLRNENMMLREDNIELRRQLTYARGGYDPPPPPPLGQSGGYASASASVNGHMPPPPLMDEKPGSGFSGAGGEFTSPRMPDRDGHNDTTSGAGPYAQQGMESMTPLSRGSRDSRVMSVGSGPGASPYISSSSTFASASDPRHHSIDSRYSSSGNGSSSHGHGIYGSNPAVRSYSGDENVWDSGPPPFPTPGGYAADPQT